MARKFGEDAHLAFPTENFEYDFVLTTEVHSMENAPAPGMSTGGSQHIFHGFNVYLFSSKDRKVEKLHYKDVNKILNEEVDQFSIFEGLEIEDTQKIIDKSDEYDAIHEIKNYADFESPVEPYQMKNAIQNYKFQEEIFNSK